MKNFFAIFLFLFSSMIFGQEMINNYKYIIVPKQFDAFKSQNQYQTSTLVKYLLTEHGFKVVYDDKLPSELNANRCYGLVVALEDNSNMFTTKTTIILKDCESNEIFKTREGVSKIKEFKGAYSEAIKNAFASFSGYTYNYSPEKSKPIIVSFKHDVKTLSVEQPLKPVVEKEAVISEAPATTVEVRSPKPESKANQLISESSLYAQNISNGYQLVDYTPKIIMKILKTSQPNIYIGEETIGTKGLVYSNNGTWIFEYYENGILKEKLLNIKF